MAQLTRIGNDEISVAVSPLGAEMQSVETADGRSWLWDGDPAFWTGRAPILFPMVGRAPDDHISIEGVRYPMNQHGFARRSDFTLIDATATSCLFELTASAATREVFPFDFALTVAYSVEGRSLRAEATVHNHDTRPMPFGFGFHPAFLWPLPGADEGARHRVTLDNGASPALIRLENGLVVPEPLASPFKNGTLVIEHPMFDADALIFPEGAGTSLIYGAEDGPRLHFAFENLPNLGIWSKPGHAPFVCIEPWHGTAAEKGGTDALAERPYSTILAPSEEARFAFTVTIEA